MGALVSRFLVLAVVLAVAAPAVRAQDLPPALAARFSEGVDALKAGQLDAAESAFRDVLARGGDRAFVHHDLGIVEQQRGRHAQALAEFRTAARLDPTFGPARLLAGSSLLALGRPREAITELERAVRLLPREKAAHVELARACEQAGDVPCLARESRVLSALAPSDPELMYRLGKAYLRLSQWAYERITALDPKSARLSEALGRELLEQGRVDESFEAYREAARRNPDLPGIHLALARIHEEKRRWAEAAAEADRELALVPESAAARELKTRVQARAGQQ